MSLRAIRLVSAAGVLWALSAVSAAAFDLQAHRGGRGLAPENTLAAFRQTMALGPVTLEGDLGITGDGVVVLSHDSRLNPDLVRDTDGKWIEPPGPRLIGLTLDELKRFDLEKILGVPAMVTVVALQFGAVCAGVVFGSQRRSDAATIDPPPVPSGA